MKGFVQNIEALATKNANFRSVLYTASLDRCSFSGWR